mmetsp:Transcript_4899/g.11496  ORF Transcript_4899/g.11496 Transcript_4899/m.11496 type:complete len:411 (-) Transcript_4899:490-1722(-)
MARVPHTYDRRATQECPCHALNGWRHRCTEHLCDAVPSVPSLGLQLLLESLILVVCLHVGAWNGQQRATYVVLEAQVHHLIRLVNHNIVALVKYCVPLVQSITQPPGSGKAAFHALPQQVRLLLCVAPANDTHHAAVAVLSELARFLLNLDDKLAAWRQDDSIGTILSSGVIQWREFLDVGENRQHVCCSLPATSLRDRNEVAHLASNGNDLHLDWGGLGVADLVNGLQELPRQRAFSPDPHGHWHTAATDEYLEVLTEDAPITRGHLVHGLVCPMNLVVILALNVTLLERKGFFCRLDESGHVLASVLRALGNELFIEAVVFALLAHINACTIATAEEKLRLQALGVERIVVPAHGVIISVPLEIEDVPELLRRLLHFLLGFLHTKVVPFDQFEFLLSLPFTSLRFREL